LKTFSKSDNDERLSQIPLKYFNSCNKEDVGV